MPGSLSPRLLEGLVRLASERPFAQAAEELRFFWGIWLGEETVRRATEGAGAALAAAEATELARLEREFPAPPAGPALQQWSMDGAFAPLVGGEWAEVKTSALGTVTTGRNREGEEEVRTVELSYCSRLSDAAAFGREVRLEVHARGTQAAGTVVAVNDGAEWIQGVVAIHRPDAVRVLDFAHALEHVATAGRATFGADTPAFRAWLERQGRALKHEGPGPVLAALRGLPVATASDPGAAAEARDATLGYLEPRLAQLQYPAFRAAGYPIGSGAVESAGKLIVERRLKGSGMRWARSNVTPMVCLRAARHSGRWVAAWGRVCAYLRQCERDRRAARWRRRHPEPASPAPPAPPDLRLLRAAAKKLRRPIRPRRVADGKLPADHPWRHRATRRCPGQTAS